MTNYFMIAGSSKIICMSPIKHGYNFSWHIFVNMFLIVKKSRTIELTKRCLWSFMQFTSNGSCVNFQLWKTKNEEIISNSTNSEFFMSTYALSLSAKIIYLLSRRSGKIFASRPITRRKPGLESQIGLSSKSDGPQLRSPLIYRDFQYLFGKI